MSYNFDQQLQQSKSPKLMARVENILKKQFSFYSHLESCSIEQDKAGADIWVVLTNGKKIAVDIKDRTHHQDFKHVNEDGILVNDDLAVETYSDLEKETVGWATDPKKITDYVLWLWPTRHELVPYHLLQTAVIENWDKWYYKCAKSTQESDRNGSYWESECMFVKRKDLWQAILKKIRR